MCVLVGERHFVGSLRLPHQGCANSATACLTYLNSGAREAGMSSSLQVHSVRWEAVGNCGFRLLILRSFIFRELWRSCVMAC